MSIEKLFGLSFALDQSKRTRQSEGIKPVNIATCWKAFWVANKITARHRRNELRIQRVDQSRQFKLLDQMTKRLNQAIGKRLDIVSCNTMRRE